MQFYILYRVHHKILELIENLKVDSLLMIFTLFHLSKDALRTLEFGRSAGFYSVPVHRMRQCWENA